MRLVEDVFYQRNFAIPRSSSSSKTGKSILHISFSHLFSHLYKMTDVTAWDVVMPGAYCITVLPWSGVVRLQERVHLGGPTALYAVTLRWSKAAKPFTRS